MAKKSLNGGWIKALTGLNLEELLSPVYLSTWPILLKIGIKTLIIPHPESVSLFVPKACRGVLKDRNLSITIFPRPNFQGNKG
jgi:hypothetical protein